MTTDGHAPGVPALVIEAVVEQGIAHLRGRVPGLEDADSAEAVAARVPGLRDVVEELVGHTAIGWE
jgi:osmotically-inducible protein OsmY